MAVTHDATVCEFLSVVGDLEVRVLEPGVGECLASEGAAIVSIDFVAVFAERADVHL